MRSFLASLVSRSGHWSALSDDGEGGDDGPTPIWAGNIVQWARQTYRTDRRDYRPKGEPVGAWRVARAVAPRLEDPIFVLGAPRSGTTFLGQCLAALPEIGYHHEPVATKAAARYVYGRRWGERAARVFFRGVFAWLARVHLDGGLRFASKNPSDGFIVPFLARAYPRSQFLHIIRDGRDAALSASRKPWLAAASAGSGRREEGGYLCGPYPRFWVEPERRDEFRACSDIRRCAWEWRRTVESALAEGPPLGPERYFELRYEALCAEPARQAEGVLDFLGVWTRASRSRFVEATARVEGRSVGRWRRELTPAQLADVEAEAGSLLRRLGYQAPAS